MGVNTFLKLKNESTFPWVLSNVNDFNTAKPFVDAQTKVIANIGELKVKSY